MSKLDAINTTRNFFDTNKLYMKSVLDFQVGGWKERK
jgi:hypothetical protein